jgi:hypothetical protein
LQFTKCFDAGLMLGFFFDPDDGGDMFSEMSVDLQRTIQRYIPEDNIHHNHRCENLKSHMIIWAASRWIIF